MQILKRLCYFLVSAELLLLIDWSWLFLKNEIKKGAVLIYDFSEKHEDWVNQINRKNMGDILDYYKRVKQWYNSVI